MIISPPFLLQDAHASFGSTDIDPVTAAVEPCELMHGIYPITFDRRWHGGAHFMPSNQKEPVRAIADGEVVAYRVGKTAISDGQKDRDGQPTRNSHTGFVLLKHTTETGEGRSLTFYSLYMHLLDIVSQNSLVPQPLPKDQKTDSSPDELAAWLLKCSPGNATEGYAVQPGHGLKVRRKDMLGYVGACHGYPHLHFEIFMTQADFNAYFGTTQLGQRTLTTPASTDVWGHSYYVIPGGQAFRSGPPLKGHDHYFPTLQNGQLDDASTLYVEAYFDKGQRYTRSWLDKGDGQLTPLTEEPVQEANYEYNLYDRANALYPDCPSDGYELLRFGRILSNPATLTDGQLTSRPGFAPGISGDPHPFQVDSPRATWVAVTFDASGSRGYVDINQNTIQKLSDADFPFITGWQKITDDHTPFDKDGLCGYDALRELVGHVEAIETPQQANDPEYKQEEQLSAYVKRNKTVRDKLRGFICEAPSEWDSTNNDTRYAGLNEPGGFFYERKDTQPNGYRDFIAFLQKLQFWDATGLPSREKLWFFHPLAFIRHFRKCGWLSQDELTQLLPVSALRSSNGQWLLETVPFPRRTRERLEELRPEFNKSLRKFNIAPSPLRMAAFIANALVETQWFERLYEHNTTAWYHPWDGRGFLQLTGPDNYIKYWRFLGRTVPEALEQELRAAASKAHAGQKNDALKDANHPGLTAQMVQWRADASDGHRDPSESAGAYWAWTRAAKFADQWPAWQRGAQVAVDTKTTKTISQVHYRTDTFGQVAATVNFGSPVRDTRLIAKVNGIVARCHAYTHVAATLGDSLGFSDASRQPQEMPDGYERRKS